MTTPDHRPFLAGTDLRTAADVAAWLRERADRDLRANCHPSPLVLHYAHAALDARLDRERRQACRRGALACWRSFCDEAGSVDWTGESLDVWGNRRRALDCLSRALAFRAAARAK